MKQLILSICMSCLLLASGGCSRLLDSGTDSGTSQWVVHQEVSPLDDSRNVIMGLFAEGKVGQTRPMLVVRCKEGETHVFIDYDSFLGPSGAYITVWIRFDQRPAKKSEWVVSSDRKAIFLPGWKTKTWLHEIVGVQKLFVRILPFGRNEVSTTFQLNDTEEAMRPLREACGW